MKKQDNAFRWLIEKTFEVKNLYIFASLFTLLSAGCFVGFGWFLSKYAAIWLNDSLILQENLLYATILLIGRYIFAHIASLLHYKAGNSVVSKIKSKLFPTLLNNNQSDSISSSLLVTRVSDDLKPFFSFFIPYALSSLLVVFLLLIVSFWVEFWVGLVLLISVIVIPILLSIIGVGASSLHKKHINLFLKYSAVFHNRLQTISEIVNLDNLNSQSEFLSKKSKTLNKATTEVMRVAILSSAVLELFVSIAIAGVAIFLGLSLLGLIPGSNYGKGYDFHIALFLLVITPYLFFYLRKFVSAYHDKNKALASAKILMPYIDSTYHKVSKNGNEALESINIQSLNFVYPETIIKVLHDINMQFPKKGLILVKGISGSGKSTLLKLLSGNLSTVEGKISVNGKNNDSSKDWLLANSSYMNQFPFVFDGSIRYNVFLQDLTEVPNDYPQFLDKILNKKEDSWNTILSHNGKQLSGGEKQLLTLARMILHPKAIAIMDEPTANLDSDTTDIIIDEIIRISEERLVVLASHEKKFEAIATEILNLNWGEQMHHV